MNILFLSLNSYTSIKERGIYTDLLREFICDGHQVYIVSPAERHLGEKTHVIAERNSCILRVKTGNIQKTNPIEKGISTVLLEKQFVLAIKKYFSKIKFGLILYATPPITIARAVEYVKKRDGAGTYLLLKDIFPQNAVDIGMMRKEGIGGILYRYFRKKEKKLYELSDVIGCMSQANVDYVLKHNPEFENKNVEICPNSVEIRDMSVSREKRLEMREKYGIPIESTVFIYGGNLGKPQGIDFLIECLRSQRENKDAFFLIVGDGTEYHKIDAFVKAGRQKNVKLMARLTKKDYEQMVGSCDVGMLFLDHRFTIPNFPSRLLDYMEARMPVIAVTDPNTDVGRVIVEGGFGWWCESNDIEAFQKQMNAICRMNQDERRIRGGKAWDMLQTQYSVAVTYKQIQKWISL